MEIQAPQTSSVAPKTPTDNEETSSTTSSGNSAAMTAMEELQQLHATDPNAERVSLRGRHLSQEDAEAALTYLQNHFLRLRHLDLRDNDLHELPQDFGSRLPKLVALNLLNNNFRFRMGALRTLGETLQHCPCLKSLSLSLSSSAEEQVLLAMLPKLRIFNGTPLPSTRSGSQGNPLSPTLQELQQFCASPSAKVSTKSSTALTQAKKTSFRIPHTAIETEATSSKLYGSAPRRSTKNSVRPTELPASISDDRTDWCKLLKVNRSQVSNGVNVTAVSAHSGPTSSAVVSTETFLQQLKAVVKAFHDCDSLGKANNSSKTKLFAQLDRHVELLAQQLKRQEPEGGKTELSEAMLQTRWSLLEVCAMFGSQKVTQADAGLGNGFGMLLAMQKQVLVAMQAQQRNAHVQFQATTEGSEATQNQHQLKQLLDVAEGLESDLEAVQLQLQQETARRELVEQENLELKRVRRGRKDIIQPGTSVATDVQSLSTTDNLTNTSQAPRRLRRHKSENGGVDAMSDPTEDTRSPEVPTHSSITPPPAPQTTVRNLSLKQLVDLINCVYASKVKYDARATTSGAPRETMEQHLYTYLNTRFGLPKLIVDYASAVWKAAEHFARRENDAAVFVALLRNRLDEGFLEIKRKLQSALVELLRAFFSARYPLKQGKVIAALVQSRLDGLLHEEEWRNVLMYLYEPQDNATLLRFVQQKAEKYQATQVQAKTPQMSEKPSLSLPFVDFEQVLYGYQLQGRLDLLDGFRRAFEELDTERVGVINRPRFVTLTRRVAPTKSESAVTKLLESLDPFNHDVITFSDAANALLPDIRRTSTKANSKSAPQTKTNKNVA